MQLAPKCSAVDGICEMKMLQLKYSLTPVNWYDLYLWICLVIETTVLLEIPAAFPQTIPERLQVIDGTVWMCSSHPGCLALSQAGSSWLSKTSHTKTEMQLKHYF
jgi:hypothetical protein